MGPHFFKCGKIKDLEQLIGCFLRFNGAALFQVRKTFLRYLLQTCLDRFNGAALFQVRKISVLVFSFSADLGFNGAALFQVRKI